MQEASKPGRFWDTPSGFKVAERFQAWAIYTLELPTEQDGGGTGAQLGRRDDMPPGFMLAMDVEITLKSWGSKRVGAYILHCYGKGGLPETVHDPVLVNFVDSLYRNRTLRDNALRRIVSRALLDFGQYMAAERGL